jgi:hypothetical protein
MNNFLKDFKGKINPSQSRFITVLMGALALGGLLYFFYASNMNRRTEFSLPVPFTTQAPTGNWEGNENCEEASAIMANSYLRGTRGGTLPAVTVQDQITRLRNWERENFGYDANTGIEETARMIGAVFSLQTELINDYSADDLKRALYNHHPVLLPLNAHILNTEKYPTESRLYHMVVVRGYNEQGFIIHDPGTVSGSDNIYTFNQLKQAAVDWNSAERKFESGKKSALVVWR